ncbi:bifunctional molybdopterin-guanine dinucleotide biosynthesis adaptor protein MobB/molybdopterin molybdotransferase MoeA [Thiothrix eikelboomii]|uniref:bifunctional molybdopterin-guanine dinucleotide biosynthesis adaptor protein MobB/molybdopterin molybdotransferase MoeA n=1 Tax=Thiothrix eikelboomii TaxID=92487 RepID=UPI003BB188EB
MSSNSLPIVGICAWSGTGKTTLITELIPLLRAQGLRLAVIKHAHHQIELDQPGKDTFRFRTAGAEQVILASAQSRAVMFEQHEVVEASLRAALELVNDQQIDLILVEGFKHETLPKIEIHRPSLGHPLLFPHDSQIIALASDLPLDLPSPVRVTQLDLKQPSLIVQFILERIVGRSTQNTTELRTTPSCADAREPSSLSLAEAQARILAAITPIKTVIKQSLRLALGQVLAEAVISPLDVPAHTNAAMDGYAIAAADLPLNALKTLPIAGSAFAGHAFAATCPPGACIRIMTGAPMPAGTDTVVMQEHTETTAEGWVRIGTGHQFGQNVRHQGEDITQGQTVLTAGRRLSPADLGLLASLGIAEVKVYRAPRVAFFSTGDELRSIGEPLEAGCVYDSNRYTLFGMLKNLGLDVVDLGVVADQPAALQAAFKMAADSADVVITSGGVSVGEADYTKTILDQLGEISFWKIAIKPGRPLAFGQLGETLFFGLPGNPVAVMVTFQQIVQPALLYLAGETAYQPFVIPARTTQRLKKKPGRTEFLRAIYEPAPDGSLTVHTTGAQGSGILMSMSRANCYIILDEDNAGVEAGAWVKVQPFRL